MGARVLLSDYCKDKNININITYLWRKEEFQMATSQVIVYQKRDFLREAQTDFGREGRCFAEVDEVF